jgi:hypothetical protein
MKKTLTALAVMSLYPDAGEHALHVFGSAKATFRASPHYMRYKLVALNNLFSASRQKPLATGAWCLHHIEQMLKSSDSEGAAYTGTVFIQYKASTLPRRPTTDAAYATKYVAANLKKDQQ